MLVTGSGVYCGRQLGVLRAMNRGSSAHSSAAWPRSSDIHQRRRSITTAKYRPSHAALPMIHTLPARLLTAVSATMLKEPRSSAAAEKFQKTVPLRPY